MTTSQAPVAAASVGEQPPFFKHPQAIVESANIGARTRVWAFAHILPGAIVGADCNICDGVFVENDVIVGDRVTVKCGVQLWDGVRLENDVFVGPNATFTNDPRPRSGHRPQRFAQTIVCARASIGANATILPGLTIGEGALVGAGAVVTKSVPPNAVAVGNPARVTGFVDAHGVLEFRNASRAPGSAKRERLPVRGTSLIEIPLVADARGVLSFAEIGRHLPFIPKRYFTLHGIAGGAGRGNHAHRELHQFLVCLNGACLLELDDGVNRHELHLDSPALGVHAPPLIWCRLWTLGADTVILGLASHEYMAADYIHDYAEFLRLVVSAQR
jgi:acetyltransferase-like isoleucine patch superfamily enzyme